MSDLFSGIPWRWSLRTSLATAAVAMGITFALVISLALVDSADRELSDNLTVEEQLQLLSHKIVVLGARQGDQKAIKREIEDLKAQMKRIEQTLENKRAADHPTIPEPETSRLHNGAHISSRASHAKALRRAIVAVPNAARRWHLQTS